ncbi:MAG: hypothetical protein IJU70_08095 [Lentisphaeria bacterium]|nr:hypothetical protein [Lentisphaeria bacterium]
MSSEPPESGDLRPRTLVWKDVRLDYDGRSLTVSNSRIRRVFDLSDGAPRTISLCDGEGRQFAAPGAVCDFSFAGLTPPGRPETPWRLLDVSMKVHRKSIFDGAHAAVSLTMEEPVGGTRWVRRYFIYPELAAMGTECSIRSKVMPNCFWSFRGLRMPARLESVGDAVRPAPGIRPVRAVAFCGRTDFSSVQVRETDTVRAEENGNLLFCRGRDGAGFFFLQEAMPSAERRDPELCDFRIDGEDGTVFSCTWGVEPRDLRAEQEWTSFRHVLFVHPRGEELRLLRRYLAVRFDQSRFHSVMVNPWGCGRFPELLDGDFLRREVRAAAEVGATHYQIDDGWQKGRSLAELLVRNRHITRDFWQLSDELRPVFADLVALCRDVGVSPALWFAPSVNCDYRDWRTSAEILWDFYTRYGIGAFKIDGVMMRTAEAEKNLRSLLRTLRTRSRGRICFNLDTTSGQRAGYFSFLEYGNVFLENRYVHALRRHNYHPENTLRSLWRLAKYVRTQALQIEVPWPGIVDAGAYRDFPCDPRAYPFDYWAAISLFANPLLWMAPSLLPPGDRGTLRGLMKLHLEIRGRLFSGDISPVGMEPDGAALTGFFADSGYLLLFRERNEKTGVFDPPDFSTDFPWRVLAGKADVRGGRVFIPEKASFVLLERQDRGGHAKKAGNCEKTAAITGENTI